MLGFLGPVSGENTHGLDLINYGPTRDWSAAHAADRAKIAQRIGGARLGGISLPDEKLFLSYTPGIFWLDLLAAEFRFRYSRTELMDTEPSPTAGATRFIDW